MRMQRSRTLTWARLSLALLTISGFGAGYLSPSYGEDAAGVADTQGRGFQVTFQPGSRDQAGHFMGGTEMRTLVAHAGKLFAGNGYWKDRPGPEGFQGAEILVLDRPDGQWRVDHDFDERMPGGRARNFAIGAMGEVRFATDKSGKPLANPVSILLASTWDLSGESDIYARDDATGVWTAEELADGAQDLGFRRMQQVRSFGSHRDRVTGIDHAFAGNQPRGVFSGVYDPNVPGRIRWSEAPELDLSTISAADFPGQARRLRVTSFAECNDRLYAAVGQQIYERIRRSGAALAPHLHQPQSRAFPERVARPDRGPEFRTGRDRCSSPPLRGQSRELSGLIRATAARPPILICTSSSAGHGEWM